MSRSRVLLFLAIPTALLIEYLCFSNVPVFDPGGMGDGASYSGYSFLPVGPPVARVLQRSQLVLMFPVRPVLQVTFRGYAASTLPPTGLRGVVFHITYPFFVMPITSTVIRWSLVWLCVLNFTLQALIVLLFVWLRSKSRGRPAT